MQIFTLTKEINILKRLPIKRIIGVAFTLVVLTYLGIRAFHGIQQLAKTGIHFTAGLLLISLFCQISGVLLGAWVWSDILKRLGGKSGYLFDLETFCVSAIARKLPGTVWYAIGRIAIYDYLHYPKSLTIIAVVIEFILIALGGLMTLGISVGSGFISHGFYINPAILFPIMLIFAIITGILGPKAIRFAIERTRNRSNSGTIPDLLRVSSWDTLRWLICETVVVALAGGVGFFLLKSIDTSLPVQYSSVLGALSLAVILGPIALWLPGDIGLKDGFLYLALSPLVGGSIAAVFTLAWRIWVSILEISAGATAGIALNSRIRQIDRKETQPMGESEVD